MSGNGSSLSPGARPFIPGQPPSPGAPQQQQQAPPYPGPANRHNMNGGNSHNNRMYPVNSNHNSNHMMGAPPMGMPMPHHHHNSNMNMPPPTMQPQMMARGGNGNGDRLSPAASPYTPPSPSQRPKSLSERHADPAAAPVAPAAPAAAAPATTTTASNKAAPATPPPATGGSVVVMEEESAEGPSIDEQVEAVPLAPPVSFADSRLPEIYEVPSTTVRATEAFLPLHATWELYLNDHSGGGGGGAPAPAGQSPVKKAYDPVLVGLVCDVIGFWKLWHHVPPPSAVTPPFTYAWFRKDIRPEYEHQRNRKGGSMSVVVYDRDRAGLNDKQALDDAFMAALLAASGETLAESATTLNGLMLKIRPNKPATLQFWTAHSDAGRLRPLANSIKALVAKVLGPKQQPAKIEFYSHEQMQRAAGIGRNDSLASRMKIQPKKTPDHTF